MKDGWEKSPNPSTPGTSLCSPNSFTAKGGPDPRAGENARRSRETGDAKARRDRRERPERGGGNGVARGAPGARGAMDGSGTARSASDDAPLPAWRWRLCEISRCARDAVAVEDHPQRGRMALCAPHAREVQDLRGRGWVE